MHIHRYTHPCIYPSAHNYYTHACIYININSTTQPHVFALCHLFRCTYTIKYSYKTRTQRSLLFIREVILWDISYLLYCIFRNKILFSYFFSLLFLYVTYFLIFLFHIFLFCNFFVFLLSYATYFLIFVFSYIIYFLFTYVIIFYILTFLIFVISFCNLYSYFLILLLS